MTGIGEALADAGRLRARFVGEHGYAVAYGSHANRPAAGDSDLDLLFVGPPLDGEELEGLVRAVAALHADHRLSLDTEVAYEIKLHASPDDVKAALALRGFVVGPAGELRIPPVVVAPWFLNSEPFKLRLILNALTTPHVFLGGDVDLYQWHCTRAEVALGLVALSLLDPSDAFTVIDIVAALVTAADGATGEDFLGYAHGPALYSAVHRGLARLATERVVTTVDGRHFRQHPEQLRSAVADLRAAPDRGATSNVEQWARD